MSTSLIFSVFICTFFISARSLEENGVNVNKAKRLVNLLEKYPISWMKDWQCEEDFNDMTCDRIRNGLINIDEVFIFTEELVCSASWTTYLPTDRGCTSNCLADWYGENCALRCRCMFGTTCDPVDGSCDCHDGWKGQDCTTRCDVGKYGPNCKNTSLICENGGVNHPLSGICLCPGSYRGDRCQEKCNPSYDRDCTLNCELCNSLYSNACDVTFGKCRCYPGWRGYYCTEPCPPGSKGPFCHEICCSGHGFCDTVNKRCLCLDGFTGPNCSEKCENGFFGRDCLQKCACPYCNHVTGSCDTCPPGYRGDRCNSSCACTTDTDCDVFTGKCLVTPTIEESINEGTPGNDDRYSDDDEDSDNDDDGERNDAIHIIVVVGVLGICGLTTVVLFIGLLACLRKRQLRTKTHLGHQPEITLNQFISDSKARQAAEGKGDDSGNHGNINDKQPDRSTPEHPYDRRVTESDGGYCALSVYTEIPVPRGPLYTSLNFTVGSDEGRD